MQPAYLALLLLMGASFLLQLQWLFLLAAMLFVVLLFSESYGGGSSAPAAIESAEPPAGAPSAGAMPAPVPTQPPIVVVTGGGGLNQSESYLTTMMAMYSAMDAYQQQGQASPYTFLSRGSVMRQNMFAHHGNIPAGQTHQGLKRKYSDSQVEALTKKMDKLIKKMGGD